MLYAFSCFLIVPLFKTQSLYFAVFLRLVDYLFHFSFFFSLSLLGEAVWLVSDLDADYKSVRVRGERRAMLKQEASPQREVDRTMST